VNDQKRYQVFISSTYLDLLEERKAVISTLLQLDTFPAGMEMFPASDDDAWELIKGVISQSDYYLLVIGGKYGSVDSSSNLSYTEMEYDYAVELGIPVMAFLHGEPDSLTQRDIELDAARRAALDAFREKVKGAKHIKYWTSAADLGMKVTTAFVQMQKNRPAVGWIRADQATGMDDLRTIERLRQQVEKLGSELENAGASEPRGTEGLSKGADRVDLNLDVGYRTIQKGKTEKVAFPANESWNDLFGSVCSALLTECAENVKAVN
jgi:hypothetical protein